MNAPKLRYHIEFDRQSINSTHRLAGILAPIAKAPYKLMGTTIKLGTENLASLPTGQGVIFAAHHMSLLDPVFVGYNLWDLGYMPHFMAKSGIFKEPLASVLRGLGQIPVLRGTTNASDSLRYASAALHSGESVVIYPQGTLTKDPDRWPEDYKSGAARLALQEGTPIVPVAHWGMHKVFPLGAKVPRFNPRQQLRIHFGQPIVTTGVASTKANAAVLTRHIESRVAAGLAELRGVALPKRFEAGLTWEK